MQTTVSKISKGLKGEIKIPGDKSISHRSVIFGSIAEGKTEVSNFLTGEDCICTRKAFEALGVEIESPSEDELIIHGKGMAALKAANTEIYLGNSGTGMRLLTGLFSALPFETTLTGDESLSGRPMKRVIDPLSQMGAHIDSQDGKAPLIIHGSSELHGIDYVSPIASAQVKSSILLAGLNAEGRTSVSEDHKSRDHTERMLEAFGADISYPDPLKVSISGKQKLSAQKFSIPSDISSAAFFIVGAAICPGSELRLPAIGMNPTRTGIIDVMRAMNVDFDLENEKLEGAEPVADLIIRHSELKATTIDGALIPRLIDEIPVIAVLAAQAQGTTVIKDAAELKVKESNRIDSTVEMVKALGINIEATDDGMVIEGRGGQEFAANKAAIIDSKGDHRIAMSAAIAALHSNQEVEILGTEFVNTSFPNFFDLLP